MNRPRSEKPSSPTEPDGPRRAFLKAGICGFASAIAASLGITSGAYLLSKSRNPEDAAWVDAGDLSLIHSASPEKITFDRVRLDGWNVATEKGSAWLVKEPDGALIAFSPLCTHLGCAYQWEANRRAFVCPCHGSSFSRTGDVITGPANRPLDRYEVKVDGSRIWLGPIEAATNA